MRALFEFIAAILNYPLFNKEKEMSLPEEAQQQAPVVPPLVQAVENVIATAVNPSPENIVADIKMVLDLFLHLKSSNPHPTALDVLKMLL